ncbi:MAG: ATP synthase F0 subunit C [Acidobacteriota bacterium]
MKKQMFKILSLVFTLLALTAPALAQETAAGGGSSTSLITVTGALAVAIAAAFGAMGDSRAIAAACEGTARNPGAGGRIFTMMILGLALIETLVLVTFLTVLLGFGK